MRHGHASGGKRSRVYMVWDAMKRRCDTPTHREWHRYGGRGIAVCQRWLVFENFLSDMGEPPEGLSLDRIDNDGPYSPENCRWATKARQQRNRRNVPTVTFNGETKTVPDWAEDLGIALHVLKRRFARGWTADRALTTRPGRYRV